MLRRSCVPVRVLCKSAAAYSICFTNHTQSLCETKRLCSGGTNAKIPSVQAPKEAPFDKPTTPSTSLPRSAGKMQKMGVVYVDSSNLNAELGTKVPFFIYFTVTNHPDINAYTDLLIHQVDQVNRRRQGERMGDAYQEFGKDAGLAIKLGIIDCLKEPGIHEKFGVNPHMFPVLHFVYNRLTVDKLTGIVSESQIKESVEAFIEYATAEVKKAAEGKGKFETIKRHDNDDENPMTLLQVAHKQLQKREVAKAKKTYEKALSQSLEEMDLVNKRYGVGKKKMSEELWTKLKREGCYNTAPQSLCGLGMCALSTAQVGEAMTFVKRTRSEYPYAVRDLRGVAEALVRIELFHITGFNIEDDNYATLLRFDDLVEDPVDFYNHHLKLVVSHYVEGRTRYAIQEALRIIRSEQKLLPALKERNIVPSDLRLGPLAETPARKVLSLVFEALGPTHEDVIQGRKMLQLYT
ncbi:hypothetical protein STCU_01252 [Strigomonas culicis]|uniref:Uncharacterized protein n=2 Tax=Strigomonas culicis TaxID=28005 RepID=S9W7C8_9TRYP|nr:hypothetical protein STCU_02436 [Strigomonas culicis]EPY35096.1 hypothetical protein STCU_01252 [Strigomonas culicis]|eukprot:EPY33193.1 hypothetical protein STCU_02436 [Strigomonas culicis]